jgi:hypothetical protein
VVPVSPASIARHHADWLQLVDVSGPFLTLPVLKRALPQGLNPTPPPKVDELRRAFQEFQDDRSLQGMWIRWVLRQLLELGAECQLEGPAIPTSQTTVVAEHGLTLRPNILVVDPSDTTPRMAVMIWPTRTELSSPVADSRWSASPFDRIAELLRATGLRLGLVTNGEAWTLVHAAPGEPTTFAGWDAAVWLEDRPTLDSFVTLLGVDRFFAVQGSDTLEALFTESANAEEEVTDQLGRQVRAAVELFVDALGRADREAGGRYLRGVEPDQIYLASVTVMMRLVFLLFAEERGLLLLGDPIYDTNYAATTLRAQLQVEFDRSGSGPLERRSSASERLLATFRMVHGGVEHETLRLPGYGGSLFDPDRFPFLEGREDGTSYLEESGAPIPVDDHTILAMLDALQTLRFTDRGVTETRRLSFRELDVEQIGHVYEGLLDHTAVLTSDPAVGLAGKFEPEIALELIERASGDGHSSLLEFLKEETGRTPKTIEKLLDAPCDADRYARLLAACENDEDLAKRIQPFHGLLRDDLRGLPTVYLAGSVYVTKSGERRSSGTYYTPRTLAEEIVRYALEPLVYSPGPQDGADPKDWKLRSPAELLDLNVCDMAMGSGAFLVAATRYLSDRLVEAWAELGDGRFTPEGESTTEEVLVVPDQPAERLGLAHRLVAERCIYGVDKNPMAVEMAKLSMWLVTLAKDRPFSFLDHALKCGDSLLGVHDLTQIEFLHLDPERGRELHTTLEEHWHMWQGAVKEAIDRRRELESFTVLSVRDAELKRELLREADEALDDLRVLGDVVTGAALSTSREVKGGLDTRLLDVASDVAGAFDPHRKEPDRQGRLENLRSNALFWLNEGKPPMEPDRRPFHWPLELPELFAGIGGFDAIVGNPPFQGGKKISGAHGSDYREYLVAHLAKDTRGNADLVAYFFLRAAMLVRSSGTVGLIATNSIGEGDTREVGLERLLAAGAAVYRADASVGWPGNSSVTISRVWMSRTRSREQCVLDGSPATAITASLQPASRVAGPPYQLAENDDYAFIGCIPLGEGFFLSQAEASALLSLDSRNREVVRPYLRGEDLGEHPTQQPSSWVIDFAEMSEDAARSFIEPWRIAESRVRPERQTKDARKYPRMVNEWWKFWNSRPALRKKIQDMERVLVISRVSKAVAFTFVPTDQVFSDRLVVVCYDDDARFGMLTSSLHWWWVIAKGSKHETRPTYNPTDCFLTFPQPGATVDIARIAASTREHRRAMMLERNEGLTKTYNRVHDSKESSADVVELRRIHAELDHAVAASFGWNDLVLDHDFHDTPQGARFTLGPVTRVEVLDRLLELNHERYAAELSAGLHVKKTPRNKVAAAPDDQPRLQGVE